MSDFPTQDVPTPEKAGGSAGFIRQVREELRKVSWPTPVEVVKMSIMVILVTLFSAALIAGLDLVFAELVFWIFGN